MEYYLCSEINQQHMEKNKSKQNKSKQSKSKQNKANQNKTKTRQSNIVNWGMETTMKIKQNKEGKQDIIIISKIGQRKTREKWVLHSKSWIIKPN